MKNIEFTKMVASGNDFVVIEDSSKLPACPAGRQAPSFRLLVQKVCDRKFGVGADGVLLLSKTGPRSIRMRIFNSDGSEAEMCGNGSRCAALYYGSRLPACPAGRQALSSKLGIRINTKAGVIESIIKKGNVKIKLTNPKDIELDIPLKVGGRLIKVNFINTGVPHAVIFVEGLDKIGIRDIGRQIRYHKRFSPKGTNVDFVEILNKNSIKVRTYERGVEDETLACGTGSVAAALVFGFRFAPACRTGRVIGYRKINVHTQSGEILKVDFERKGKNFSNVWLEGKAEIVYKGEYYV